MAIYIAIIDRIIGGLAANFLIRKVYQSRLLEVLANQSSPRRAALGNAREKASFAAIRGPGSPASFFGLVAAAARVSDLRGRSGRWGDPPAR
jgi:hypothetical protein